MFTAMEKHATSIKTRTTKVGRVEMVSVEDIGDEKISARIDTGATYSAIWASGVETNIGLEVSFMGGKYKHTFQDFSRRVVRSSTGHSELRYVVKLLVKGACITHNGEIINDRVKSILSPSMNN
jgi:hypothetical protein